MCNRNVSAAVQYTTSTNVAFEIEEQTRKKSKAKQTEHLMGFPVDVENEYIYPPHGHILSFYNIIMVLFMCGPLPLGMTVLRF